MIKACDLTKNSVVEINGDPHVVEQLRVQTPSARGAATIYKVRFRNVRTRSKLDQSFRGDDPLQETDYETRLASFSFREGDRFTFMDQEDYSQFEVMADEIEDAVPYLTDGLENIKVLVQDGKVLSVQLPDAVVLVIAECAPACGASATAGQGGYIGTGWLCRCRSMEPGSVFVWIRAMVCSCSGPEGGVARGRGRVVGGGDGGGLGGGCREAFV